MTGAERKLWYRLRDRALVGHKFRRQCAIGNYIVDFCCIERRLIVELDGEQHYEKTKAYDEQRTKELGKRGFKVIRFWNQEVANNLNGLLEEVLRQL
jgi:very-short-patch-repair endonuclease